MPDTPVLEMSGITKYFPGVTANSNIDLQLYPGEVLALLGENGAGKSTLMNILVGLYRADAGEIYVKGNRVHITSPRDADLLGIGMVHQNFMLVESLTVAENIILGMEEIGFTPDMKRICREISELSRQYDLEVDPTAYIRQLSVGEQQRVEILKLLYRGAEILILDEPTAVLTPQESRQLNSIVGQMISEGKSAVFITHKMEEVIRFSHRVEVLRRGEKIAVKRTSETSPGELAQLMVGREVLFCIEKPPAQPGNPVLELRHVAAVDERDLPVLHDITLEVRSGEILGIAGVAGNGQQELTGTIMGLYQVADGEIFIKGEEKTNHSTLDIINSGVSFIPSDRMTMGVVGDMSVASNLALKGYRKKPLTQRGILHPGRILEFARRMIELFNIATPSPHTLEKFLSGGNIQKTILAREIEACGGVLIASYPTRGLDVGAIEAVRRMLVEERNKDNGILLISEELEELLSVADRIAVLYEGRIMGVLSCEEADKERLGLMMAGMKEER
jgi:simple sugar transport system ATP-binding protein